ncbi:MAG: hypothetical protein NTY37_05970 [Methanothrix sp.]|nr:hypothetical protein [Methanothrix sp.]
MQRKESIDGVAGMMRRFIEKGAFRRPIEKPNQEETRGKRAFRPSASASSYIVHRRSSEKKPDKWVEVKLSDKTIKIKSGDMKLAAPGKMTNTVSIKVQLPPGFLEHSVRRFDVPEDKDVGIIQDMLSKRFGVERGQWKLYGNTNEGSKLLKRDEPIKKYDMKENTLYFYPEY